MEGFTPLPSLAGGALIGLAAGALWLLLGRVAGVSGILGGALRTRDAEGLWRVAFVLGLPLGAWLALRTGAAPAPEIAAETNVPVAIVDRPDDVKPGLVADYTLHGHEAAYMAGHMAAGLTRTARG